MNNRQKLSRESSYGFDMGDEDVGPGEYRDLAIEIKHLFEGIANDADEQNEEVFFSEELERAIRRLLVDPSPTRLQNLLEVSPVLTPTVEELRALIKIAKPTERGT